MRTPLQHKQVSRKLFKDIAFWHACLTREVETIKKSYSSLRPCLCNEMQNLEIRQAFSKPNQIETTNAATLEEMHGTS